MEKHGIKFLYPGHYFGKNPETRQRVDDEATLSKDILSGKVKGESNPRGRMGLNLVVSAYGVRINYSRGRCSVRSSAPKDGAEAYTE